MPATLHPCSSSEESVLLFLTIQRKEQRIRKVRKLGQSLLAVKGGGAGIGSEIQVSLLPESTGRRSALSLRWAAPGQWGNGRGLQGPGEERSDTVGFTSQSGTRFQNVPGEGGQRIDKPESQEAEHREAFRPQACVCVCALKNRWCLVQLTVLLPKNDFR